MELKLNFRMEATFPVSPLSEDFVDRQGEGMLAGKGPLLADQVSQGIHGGCHGGCHGGLLGAHRSRSW